MACARACACEAWARAHLWSVASVLFPHNIITTSSPRSSLTLSIHRVVFLNDFRSAKRPGHARQPIIPSASCPMRSAKLTRDVISHNRDSRVPNVRRNEGPKLLLSRSVPELQAHDLILQIHEARDKVDADRDLRGSSAHHMSADRSGPRRDKVLPMQRAEYACIPCRSGQRCHT